MSKNNNLYEGRNDDVMQGRKWLSHAKKKKKKKKKKKNNGNIM